MQVLERDRFGQRPLYYAVRADRLFSGARADVLLRELGLPRRLDPAAAALALCDALPPQASLFRGLARVPPGHALKPHGELAALPPAPPPGAPLLDSLRAALQETRGAACSLSGGLACGLLLALLAEHAAAPRAFTLASEAGDPHALRSSERLAAACRAEHVVVSVDERGLPEHAVEAVLACEEPLSSGAAVARLLFFRKLRQAGERVLISGTGADELLLGRPNALRAWPPRRRAERELAEDLLTPAARARLGTFAETGAELEALRRAAVETLLPSALLPGECRTAAFEGVTLELPYLHPRFAAEALALPASACVREGVGARPLREAARGLVPEELRGAPEAAGPVLAARERWLELYREWLSPERLLPLECVEPRKALGLLDRLAVRQAPAPLQAAQDAVLLRLSSLAMLAAPG